MADSALHYRYNPLPQNIICADTAIAALPATVDALRASRAMILCGPTILRACNVVPRVQEALGGRYAGVYAGVAPHAPVETVEEGVAMAKEVQPDVFISVGGGSTHDTTKAIATLLAEGGNIRDYAIRFEPPNRITVPPTPAPKLPILSVPTTMGCAEFSRGGGGITDHQLGRKLSLAGDGVTPRTVIIDGQALATTPGNILVSTAIGQLRIAIETVYSTGHNPIGDGMALHAIRLLFQHLPTCTDSNLDTLLTLKTACVMASLASFGGLGLNTATCHHVGGLYNVPHGEANAILLPHTMRYNLDACADRQRLIAEAIGVATRSMSDTEAGLAAAEAVDRLCRGLGLPRTLREVDVPEAGLASIAAATLHDRSLSTNPKPIHDAGPILEVLRAAY
ncbi:MAG: iron-containing alcohol dehydrogenase [Candidatus Tectomicrobia bacterium]|uniref:Iron-containing alcohol dehydrogenase n=1 Tax=Tectimicrobiota bacterium TaxID=2528274 RepID=A0A938B5F0_UNCTE|nr:iron-containing alcohol dehydrogenase [Candidatus Tectomicrobia bacterium]